MNENILTVTLAFEAHSLAQNYSQWHHRPEKAKQIYLNTLAVYAVEFYFQILGCEIDYDNSDSRNLLAQKFLNVADLNVKELGKFECCPVLPNSKVLEVPPETWDDRIGYIAVQLDQSLKEAKLIGFTPTVADRQGIVLLDELHSIEEFPDYLSQKRQKTPQFVDVEKQQLPFCVDLEKWLDNLSNVFNDGWQEIKQVIGEGFSNQRIGMAAAFRGGQSGMVDLKDPKSVKRWIKQVYASQLNAEELQAISLEKLDINSALMQLIQSTQDAEIQWQAADYLWQINPKYPNAGQRGVKDLGLQLAGYPITLIIAILPIHNDRRAVRLQISTSDKSYLPSGLKLIVLDEGGQLIREVSSRSQDDYIQYKFTAEPGDRFSVKVSLAEASLTEFFAA